MRQVYQNSYIANYHSMGNVAIKEQVVPKRKQNTYVPKQVPRTQHKTLTYELSFVLFIAAAAVGVLVLCAQYLKLNAQSVRYSKEIMALESQLFELQEENRTEKAYIESKVNLLEIKEKAMNELGMVYPVKGQVYFYKQENNDYVTQYREIPE